MFKLKDVKAKATNFLNGYKEKDPATYAAAQEAIGGILMLDGFIGIDNPLGGKKRSGIFGSLLGVVGGIVFIVIGFYGPTLFGLNKLTAQTTATVVSVGAPSAATTTSNGTSTGRGACSLTAKYSVDGKDYSSTSSSSSSSNCGKSVGLSIAINYNPDQPGSWATNVATTKKLIAIFGFVGIFVVLASLFTFSLRLLSIIFGWKLLQSGRALAKTLPTGTNLSTVIHEIRGQFAQVLHGGSAMGATTMSPLSVAEQFLGGQQVAAVQQAVTPVMPVSAEPPVQSVPPTIQMPTVVTPSVQPTVPEQQPPQASPPLPPNQVG